MKKLFFEKYKTSEVTNTRSVINTPSAFTRQNFFSFNVVTHTNNSLRDSLIFSENQKHISNRHRADEIQK